MAYSVDGRHEVLFADDSERDEQVDGDERMDDYGAVLTLRLREQPRREVVDGRWRAVARAQQQSWMTTLVLIIFVQLNKKKL